MRHTFDTIVATQVFSKFNEHACPSTFSWVPPLLRGLRLITLANQTWLASDYIVPDTPQQLPLGLSFAQNAQDRLYRSCKVVHCIGYLLQGAQLWLLRFHLVAKTYGLCPVFNNYSLSGCLCQVPPVGLEPTSMD